MTQKLKLPLKRGRGRPAHEPTPALRRKVSVAAGGGMRHQDIAIALGISHDTLERYYELELSEGALGRRMEIINAMHAAGKRGASSAAKLYLEHAPKVSSAPVPAAASAEPAATPMKPEPVGKKAQANADAITAQAGTEWESLLPPANLQ